jgi:hypothetical protein
MMKTLRTLTVIALAGMTAIVVQAGQDQSESTKPWLTSNQAPSGIVQVNLHNTGRCPACQTPVTVTREVGTKPSQGTVQGTVLVDRCPGCLGNYDGNLKHVVHTCTMGCCKQS